MIPGWWIMVSISNAEAKDILISVMAISLALSIAQFGLGIFANLGKLGFVVSFFAVTVGTGFVLHELAHKFVAIAFGGRAEFRMWMQGLVLALVFSLLGFVFVAPGAVYIYAPRVSRMQNALIALAGPLMNLALAFAFIGAGMLFPIHAGGLSVWFFASKINIWLGLFNMIPIFPLDGSKVMDWSFAAWAVSAAVFAVLFFL